MPYQVPDPIDIQVGITLRQLRKERGLSQTELGDSLGLTFQQVQKYERGVNRISASMLVKAAQTLKVHPGALLPAEIDLPEPAYARTLSSVRGADDLLKAYAAIAEPRYRRALLQLALVLAAAPVTADPNDC